MDKKRPVVIFGLGDFARIAAVYLDTDSPYTVPHSLLMSSILMNPLCWISLLSRSKI